jgi:undecaprenyl-diphosphatase
MPEWLAVVILGIIEGVTEFLPISSTGHLLIPQNLGWLPKQSDLFNVGIQSGAVLAVIAVFTKRVKEFCTQFREPATRDYLMKLGAAFLVTAIGGVVIKKVGVKLPETIIPVAWATLHGGIVILALERWLKTRSSRDEIGWLVALAVGGAQLTAAIFPGTSRSAASILMALALGVARSRATEFSFLLGIPTLLAAGGLKLVSELKDHGTSSENWSMLALGTVVSAVTAFFVVKWLLRFVQSHTFNIFGWYRIALGLALFGIAMATRG